jgi:hypothetical protein
MGIAAPRADAWVRPYASDDELASRSDSIVVGHLTGTIEKVAFASEKMPNGQDFELDVYRARLAISAVITGSQPLGETPLIIHYGLRPVALVSHPSFADQLNPPAVAPGDSTSPVGIFDSATTALGGPPSDDIRKDHLWFLRRNARGPSGRPEPSDAPGIASPDDVQSLSEREYYEALVQGASEGLQPFIDRAPWRLEQMKTAQARLKIMEICRNPDLSARADALLPIWEKGDFSGVSQLALDKIFACGPVGAAKLLPEFEQGGGVPARRFVLTGLTKMGYKPAIPILIDFLARQVEWWKTRTFADREFAARDGQRGGAPYQDPRAVSFRDMYCVIEALESFNAKEALPVISASRNQWKSVKFDSNNDLLGVCDSALSHIR